jgi:UDP-N-acetylmuramyl pentapeptide phosphotransferase/UDP-N-acetylglucosamine-1-phosphate transferase
LNPDFVKLVKERFSPEDTIHATCPSGGHGAMAISMLAAAESTNAYNILDGMEGSRVGCAGKAPLSPLDG